MGTPTRNFGSRVEKTKTKQKKPHISYHDSGFSDNDLMQFDKCNCFFYRPKLLFPVGFLSDNNQYAAWSKLAISWCLGHQI